MHKTPLPFQIVPWNTDLLLSIKNLIIQNLTSPSDAVVIFPHSRPARHLMEVLRLADDIPKPCLLPRVLTVQELATLIRAELPARPQRSIELLDRVALLYECIQGLAQDDEILAKHLYKSDMHQFFPWGVRLASLMEEFFTQDIQPANLVHTDGEVSAFAASLLGNLGHIYQRYETALDARRWTTTGLDALRAAQNITSPSALPPSISNKTIIIAGFATLSGTEEALFKHLWQNGMAHVLLHTDHRVLDAVQGGRAKPHWTCEDHIKWIQSWGAQAELACPPSRHETRIDFCQGYDLHSQLHELGTILGHKNISHSALVLPDTSLLMPVLHHIPDKNVNISMGYPLSRSTLFRLLETLMRLQESRTLAGEQALYHWSPCIDFIRHPYIKMLSVVQDSGVQGEMVQNGNIPSDVPRSSTEAHAPNVAPEYERPLLNLLHSVEDKVRSGSRFVDLELLLNEAIYGHAESSSPNKSSTPLELLSPAARELGQSIITSCLTAWEHATTPAAIASAMAQLCHVLLAHGGDLWERFPIDGECLYRLMERVIPSLQECSLKDHYFSQDVLFSIVRETIRSERVPFEAEPLEGLQVLGMLESRLLHFNNIVVVDATDDALPGSAGHDPLLPDSLRPTLQLPNAHRRERVTAHNFHRLLAGAEHVTLLWQHSAGSGLLDSKRTRSRFVEELLWKEERKQGKILQAGDGMVRTISCRVAPAVLAPTEIVKTAAVRAQLMHYLQKPLSPSKLNTYLTCPFRFYHEYVCGLRVPDAVLEGDDPASVGDVLHSTLHAAYTPWLGRTIKDGDLSPDALVHEFFQQLESSDLPKQLPADSLAMLNIAGPMRLRSYLERQGPTLILALESTVSADISVDDCTLTLAGRVDRVDRREGLGDIILDYKSGSVSTLASTVWDDADLWLRLQAWQGDGGMPCDGVMPEERDTSGYATIASDGHDLFLELGKKIPSIQMPCYLYMYAQSHPESKLYDAAYVELRDKGQEHMLFGDMSEEDRIYAINEQIPILMHFLARHLLRTPSFKACEGPHCDWCPFSHICTVQEAKPV